MGLVLSIILLLILKKSQKINPNKINNHENQSNPDAEPVKFDVSVEEGGGRPWKPNLDSM